MPVRPRLNLFCVLESMSGVSAGESLPAIRDFGWTFAFEFDPFLAVWDSSWNFCVRIFA